MEEEKKTFKSELESLINRYGIDNNLGMFDFLIAEYIVQNLELLRDLNKKNDISNTLDTSDLA